MLFSGFRNDDKIELPSSTDWFKLDGEVGLGRANKRAELVNVESLLANSGDLDLSEIGGPTGYGLYTVEDGVKKYQSRNGLAVDGWMRPGGYTRDTSGNWRDQGGSGIEYRRRRPQRREVRNKDA